MLQYTVYLWTVFYISHKAVLFGNMYLIVIMFMWPTLWSSGQSSWLQTQGTTFVSWCFQIFWVAVGLKQGPLSLMRINEELLEIKSSGSCLENWDLWPWGFHCTEYVAPLSLQKLALKFANQWWLLSQYSLLAG
jgi:hypothetical protein